MGMNPRLLRPTQSGFSPRRIANLAGWWDAGDESTVTLNSGNVSEWRNKSGISGYDFAQSTANLQPSYGTNTINGRKVITNTAANYLGLSGAGLDIARNIAGLTMFAVHRTDSTPVNANRHIFAFSTNGNSAAFRAGVQILATSRFWQVGGRRLDADSFANANSTSAAAQGTSFVSSGLFNYTGTTCTIWANGSQVATNASFQTSGNASDTASLAGTILANGAGANNYTGDFCELVIYQRALSTLERTVIERWLGAKWGITVA